MEVGNEEAEKNNRSSQARNQMVTSLGRQSSIYSLTLDEFQHTLCDSGKNFGSMNMDEFLASIWTAEENQAFNNTNFNFHNTTNNNNNDHHLPLSVSIDKQPSLARQGSLTLPAPLCRKTVDEVWSEIHRGQQAQQQQHNNNCNSNDAESAPRQPTFGEMTLEDFLVKAGVVREQNPAPPPQPPLQQYGVGPSYVSRPAAAAGMEGGGVQSYQTMPQGTAVAADSLGYGTINGQRNGGYQAVCYGGYQGAAPVSPVSSDGMCTTQVENAGALRGRKRIIDGPVQKVVERRQRRMIKNRESAARSRARKQAYTVELEAELNQLREENAQLKQALAELERKRKQQNFEEMKMKNQTKAYKAKEKLRMLRRNLSCPL